MDCRRKEERSDNSFFEVGYTFTKNFTVWNERPKTLTTNLIEHILEGASQLDTKVVGYPIPIDVDAKVGLASF